jgi:CheY-like chemotaxis protein
MTPTAPVPDPARHVLIIEDDMLTSLDLQSHLAPLGYGSFAFASTVEQAQEQARLRAPDLATVDYRLLDGDGPAAMRAVETVCGRVATLFITGDPREAERFAPGRIVLAKPYDAETLRQAVAKAEAAVRNAL